MVVPEKGRHTYQVYGEQMQEAIENPESAVSSLEEAIDYATSAIEG